MELQDEAERLTSKGIRGKVRESEDVVKQYLTITDTPKT